MVVLCIHRSVQNVLIQLQSIKNAVNTYQVSFTIYTPNRNREAEPSPVDSSLQLYNSEGGSSACPIKCHPRGLWDSVCNVHHWSQPWTSKWSLLRWKSIASKGQHSRNLRKCYIIFSGMSPGSWSFLINPHEHHAAHALSASSKYQQVYWASTQNSCSPWLLNPGLDPHFWSLDSLGNPYPSPSSPHPLLSSISPLVLVLLAPWVFLSQPSFYTQALRTPLHLPWPKLSVGAQRKEWRLVGMRNTQNGDSGAEKGRKYGAHRPLPRLSGSDPETITSNNKSWAVPAERDISNTLCQLNNCVPLREI